MSDLPQQATLQMKHEDGDLILLCQFHYDNLQAAGILGFGKRVEAEPFIGLAQCDHCWHNHNKYGAIK